MPAVSASPPRSRVSGFPWSPVPRRRCGPPLPRPYDKAGRPGHCGFLCLQGPPAKPQRSTRRRIGRGDGAGRLTRPARGDGTVGLPLGQTQESGADPAQYPTWPTCWVPAPHYIRPSQDGVAAVVPRPCRRQRRAAGHLRHPLPHRRHAATDTLAALAEHRICAIKDRAANAAKTQALIADGRWPMLAGECADVHHPGPGRPRRHSAASAHWQAPHFVALMELLRGGDLSEARRCGGPCCPWVGRALRNQPGAAFTAHAGWMQ